MVESLHKSNGIDKVHNIFQRIKIEVTIIIDLFLIRFHNGVFENNILSEQWMFKE